MNAETLKGRCLCGACGFELSGAPKWVGHCHCQSCRRATASPFTTWIGQDDGTWRFIGTPPVHFSSSPGVTRGFCGTCGSPMFFRSQRWPGETHFYAALLDDPAAVQPKAHYHSAERLSWVHLSDDLPRK